MKLPVLALQKAIYDRLKGNLAYPVYDHVPDGAAMPYITLGEDTTTDWSTKPVAGVEVTHTVHVWSDYSGMAEVKRIINEVVQVLTESPLSVEGFSVVLAKVDFMETMRDPEGFRHGVVRLRFKVHE